VEELQKLSESLGLSMVQSYSRNNWAVMKMLNVE
jgi:hypothetical protein